MASNLLDKNIEQDIISKLNELLQYAYENSSYYQQKYGIGIPIVEGYVDIKKIPYIIREEIQDQYPYGPICVNVDDIDAYFETTGSTGNPLPVMPDMSMKKASKFGEFLSHWMNLKNSRIRLAIVALPYEMNPMGLKYHFSLSSQEIVIIPASVRTFLCPPRKVIELICDLKPQLLVGRPLEIMRYAEAMYFMGGEADRCSIRKIFLTGETMSDAKWKRIDNLYGGVDIYSTYGLTELDTGLISCPQYHYHLPKASNIIVELVDESGKDVPEGTLGDIIITNLDRTYAPLIRYNTGDCGMFYSKCSCGMDTPYLKIMGRRSDITCLNGKDIFPVDIEQILFEINDLGCEYQLILDDNKLTIRSEKALNCTRENQKLEKRVKEEIKHRLGIECNVEILDFNKLSDKLGIAKVKGCRFIDVTGMGNKEKERVLMTNICNGEELQ